MAAGMRLLAADITLLILGLPLAALAEVSLPSTLVTEGAVPATEVEATFTLSKSTEAREYGLGLSSLQYAPVPSFGIKLAVPFTVRDPRDSEPTVGGIGDVSLMAKHAPVMLPTRQLALAGGLKLTVPTGSERRDLGGTLALAPFLAAGKGFGPLSLQADASYSWQLNEPVRDKEGVRPDKEQELTANLTGTYSPVERLGLILELNSATMIRGEDDLKDRVQLYLTPGVGVQPAPGWDLRAGVQLPVTSAREFDYNLIVILTKGF